MVGRGVCVIPWFVVPYLSFGHTVESFGVVFGLANVRVRPIDSDLMRLSSGSGRIK